MAIKKAKKATELPNSGPPKVREADEAETKFLEQSGFIKFESSTWFSEDRLIHFCREPLENPWFGEVENKGDKLICAQCRHDLTELKDPLDVLRVLGGKNLSKE